MTSAKSIRARLMNMSRTESISFELILIRYFHERFLYRLSVSEYVNNFFLKGGSFIYAVQGILARPTKDIDLLGKNISNKIEEIKNIITEIVKIKYKEDFVSFNTESIHIEPINEKNMYNGVRLKIEAQFDTIKQQIQIDIGFGDIVIPKPIRLAYPVLLQDVLPPKIIAYTIETAIAEKFQAMIYLATLNSRMKDFFDVYNLLTKHSVNIKNLQIAIIKTFKLRKTTVTKDHSLFTDEFQTDKARLKMWNAFLKKINYKDKLTFKTVMKTIIIQLKPIVC